MEEGATAAGRTDKRSGGCVGEGAEELWISNPLKFEVGWLRGDVRFQMYDVRF